MGFVPNKKKDRKHRDHERNDGDDLNLPLPVFERVDSFTASSTESAATASTASFKPPLPEDLEDVKDLEDPEEKTGETDEDRGPGFAKKISAVLCLPFFVGIDCLKKTWAVSWGGIAWVGTKTGQAFRKIGSFFVWKSNEEDEEEQNGSSIAPKSADSEGQGTSSVEPVKRFSVKGTSSSTVSAPEKFESKPNPASTRPIPVSGSPAVASSVASVVDAPDSDEEEKEGLHWRSVVIKLAALAAMVLLVVGGYFGVKTYLDSKKDELGDQASVKSTATNEKSSVESKAAEKKIAAGVPASPETAKPPVANPFNSTAPVNKEPEKPMERGAAAAKKPEEKTPEKPVERVAAAVRKPEEKDSEKPVERAAAARKPEDKDSEKPVERATAASKKPEDKDSEKPVERAAAASKKSEERELEKPVEKAAAALKKSDERELEKPAEKAAAALKKSDERELEKPAEKAAAASKKSEERELEKPEEKAAATPPKPVEKDDPWGNSATAASSVPSSTDLWGSPSTPSPGPTVALPGQTEQPLSVSRPEPKLTALTVAPPPVPTSDGFPALTTPIVQTSSPGVPSASRIDSPVNPAPPVVPPLPTDSLAKDSAASSSLASLQPLAASAAVNDTEKPLAIPDPSSTTMKSLTVPPLPPVASSFDAVTERKPEFPTTSFSAAPPAPAKDVSFSEPSISALPSMNSSSPVPEVVPRIPLTGGTVEPITMTISPKPNLSSGLGIPNDPVTPPESSATFAAPNVVQSSKPAPSYVPPIVAVPTPVSLPIPPPLPSSTPSLSSSVPAPVAVSEPQPSVVSSTSLALPVIASSAIPTVSSGSSAAPLLAAAPKPGSESATPSEQTLRIPEPINAPIIEATPGKTDSLVAAPERIAVAPLQVEQQRLAEIAPPLGTQLQNGIQEARQSANGLSFGAAPVTAMGGAVRYNAKTSQTETASVPPMSIPTEPNNPASNPLLALNPSAAGGGNASELPSLQSAPVAKLATIGPKYQRPLSDATDSEDSATSYRQRMGRQTPESPSDVKTYIVQSGDTYMKISDRFYETTLLYRALAVHNRRRGAAWIPEVGTEVEIPSPEYLQSNYAEVLSRAGERSRGTSGSERRTPSPIAAAISSVANSAPPNANRGGVRYVVQEGDTVFKIAEERLRDTGKWKEIIQWNNDQLQDARDLRPGMEIVLPVSGTPTYSTLR